MNNGQSEERTSQNREENTTPNKRPRDSESNPDYSSPRHHQGRRYNDRNPRDHQRRRTGGYNASPAQRPISVAQQITDNFLKALWTFGDSERFDFRHEIPELVKRTESHHSHLHLIEDILKAFRIAAAELPHKLPHLALMISFLSVPPPASETTKTEDPSAPSIGVQIIRDLARTFQLHIDNRRWRSTRLYLHLFGHLHALSRPLVSSHSLLALLRAIFSATTDELTCTGARADECLRIVCEGLLRSNLLKSEDDEVKKEVNELVESIRVHMVVNRRLDRSLFNESDCLSQYIDPVEELVAALDGAPSVDILPVLDEAFGPLLEQRIAVSDLESPYPKPFDLPIVLLPPDVEEPGLETHPPAPKPENLGTDPGPIPLDSKDRTNYLGVKLFLKLFSDNTVPNRATANGVVLRTLVNDVIDIFEVNRKECAKILLELPRWVGRGTFKTKGAVAKPKTDEAGNAIEESTTESSEWILEHLLLESILTSVFATPTAPIRPVVYYHSLIVELCRLSPSTVAPALGKSVRRLYGGLGEVGADAVTVRLEPEGIRRFAEWFGIHLSNFGFLWAWKDWTDVTQLPVAHPKRVFVSRVIELEIRLSYYDRIKETVPSAFLDAELMPSDAPGPAFEYEDPAHRDHLAALDVVQLLKHKEPVSRLLDYLTKMQERLMTEGIQEPVQDVTREVAIQALLNVGSRSFSHFLNILERYLELLRNLTNSANARASLLQTVSKFWRKNGQFELIVIDKLLEYRVIDPIDSLRHSFETYKTSQWGELQFWDGMKLTIEKVTKRVKASRTKLAKLKKDEEDQRDRQRAAGGEILETGNGTANMGDINMKEGIEGEEGKKDEEPTEEAQGESTQLKEELETMRRDEIATAERELEANLTEQVVVLAEAISRFSSARSEAEEKLKTEQESVGGEEEVEPSNGEEKDQVRKVSSKDIAFWKAWWLRGWCREFYRLFGTEICTQFDQIMERLDHPKQSVAPNGHADDQATTEAQPPTNGLLTVDEKIKEEIKLAKEWVETVGLQSM
ncbi:hypothetical protein PGT21_011973 [Puccinia graminis f. sp. tritici]|uniref:MIF4G domain-containing protein n=1 Tax=Puccinia graminis f. sp. tritici TaxID=56615 RepID=A0A5B0M1H2_PUCGR|nr:hypothetical protein PGT21_011973 [Puccinia graminis f. sp. tritici]KAA1089977.1 hypothetical protein PGTUg99_032059 [Puccinia graminis f. sp. tritici]